jgi:hypothetical protein
LFYIAGAFIAAFIARTLIMVLRLFDRTSRGLIRTHALAFLLVTVTVATVRWPAGAFAPVQLLPYFAGQLFWLQYDVFVRKFLRSRRSAG